MAIQVPIVSEFVDKGIKSAIKEFESLEGPAAKAGFALEEAFLPATAALGGLSFAGLNFAKIAAEDEESANRLAGQLRRSTGATEENVAAVEAQIAAMEMASGIADLDLRQSLGRLVSQTLDTEDAFEGLELALDIAAATGKPLQTVTEALARAYGGNEQALKRLDPQMEALIKDGASLDEVLDGMRDTFGGANEEMMAGATGGFRRMQLQIDNTREAIGFAVLPLVTTFLPALQRLAEFGQDNAEILARVGMVVGGLAAAIVGINMVMKIFATIMAVVKGVTLLFNIVLAANPVVLITLAVIALVAILIGLEKRFGIISMIVRKIGDLFGDFRRIVSNVFEAIVRAVSSFIRFASSIVGRLLNILTLPFRLYFNFVRAIINRILNLIRGLPARIRAFVNAIRDRLREPFNRAMGLIRRNIDSVVGFVRGLPRRIGAFLGAIRDRVVEPFNKGKDLVMGAIDSIVGAVRGLGGRIRSAASGAFNGLWNAFKGAVNRIIRGWNSLKFTIPSVSAFGFRSPSFSIGVPQIPTLAKGGIVTGPTLALVGEAGPEAVIPLNDRHGLGMGTVVVNVAGSVVSESDLIETVRRGLVESQRSGRRLAI